MRQKRIFPAKNRVVRLGFLALVSFWMPALFAGTAWNAQEDAPEVSNRPAGLDSVFSKPNTALFISPECDQEIQIKVRGDWYNFGLLHRKWRVAVATYRVQAGENSYRLRVAFNRNAEIVDWGSDPPEYLPDDLAEACRGLAADAMNPVGVPAEDPRFALMVAARRFIAALRGGELERALYHALWELDTESGATP